MSDRLSIISSLLFPDFEGIDKNDVEGFPGSWVENEKISSIEKEQDIELLRYTINHLKKEKEQLEERKDEIKQKINVIARKRRLIELSNQQDEKYIFVQTDFIPSEQDLKSAGLEGWEWITSF